METSFFNLACILHLVRCPFKWHKGQWHCDLDFELYAKNSIFGFYCLLWHFKNTLGNKMQWVTRKSSKSALRFTRFTCDPLHFISELNQNKLPKGPHTISHLCFPKGSKNTNLVEEVELLIPVLFRQIPFSSCREVEKDSANQRQGQLSLFSDWPKTTNGKEGRVLASCLCFMKFCY